MVCAACTHENPSGANYCNRCGAALGSLAASGPATERRQLSVLFCDVVGSARLAEYADPEELRELMARYHGLCAEVIGRHEGYVAQYLGDGVLAYFGYPAAHEDDAERAVRSGLEIQRRLGLGLASSALRARIGIHTGLAVIGSVGGEHKREPLAFGSATNAAARIQELAAPGGVAISEATYRLTTHVVARDLGQRNLRGLDEPVRVYAVEQLGDKRSVAGGSEIPLFGRGAELARLREWFEAARERRGRAVLITGEPGIGKSRLAAALRDETALEARIWVDVACSPYSAGSALYPIAALFEKRFGLRDELAPEKRPQLVLDGLARAPGVALERAAPHVLALLGLPVPPVLQGRAVTPEQQRERMFEALCELAESVGERQTIVLAVEDLQWADPSTRELVERLARLAERTRLLVLCTARPERGDPALKAACERIDLARLPLAATVAMVEALCAGHGLSVAQIRAIADRSDGIPLFVEQLTRAVSGAETSPPRDERASEPSGDRTASVPATLRGLLMARLDDLGAAKRVAQLAATVGREFDRALLARVADDGGPALDGALGQLASADLITPIGDTAHRYAFRHALIQETAYESLVRADRRRIHAAVARALQERSSQLPAPDLARLAHHCREAELHDDSARHYFSAGAAAAARYANEEAVASLRLALDALARLPRSKERDARELAACLALAPPLIVSRTLDDPEVEALHERIAELSRRTAPGVGAVPALLYLSRYHLRRGASGESAMVGGALLEIARASGNPLVEVAARLTLGSCEVPRSHASVAIAHLQRALEVAAAAQLPLATSALEPEPLAFIHATLGLALAVGGCFDAARASAQAARARSLATGHDPTQIHVLSLSTTTLCFLGEFETALAWGREALALANGRGFGTVEAQSHTMLGWSRAALGDASGADEAEEGLARAIAMGFRGGLCQFALSAAEANRLAGRFARALELLEQARATADASGEASQIGRIRRVRGLVQLGLGNVAEGEAELGSARELLAASGARGEELMTATELLRLARGTNREATLREQVAKLDAELAGVGAFRPLRDARALLARAATA